jgi:RNA polymerase sigma-70 factor (ECF subfamily)
MSTFDFNQSFFQYTRSLKAFAYHLTQDHNEADDLYQDTAYKAFRYQRQYEPRTNLLAWLMTIMRNTFINEWRRRRRRQNHQDDNYHSFLLDSGHATDNAGEGKLMSEEIIAAIERLDPGVREPFLMSYQGFKYEEIANSMGLPLGTVKSRIHVARRQLQQQLRAWYQAQNVADIVS